MSLLNLGEGLLMGAQRSAPLLRAMPVVQEVGTRHKPLFLRLYWPNSCTSNQPAVNSMNQAFSIGQWRVQLFHKSLWLEMFIYVQLMLTCIWAVDAPWRYGALNTWNHHEISKSVSLEVKSVVSNSKCKNVCVYKKRYCICRIIRVLAIKLAKCGSHIENNSVLPLMKVK